MNTATKYTLLLFSFVIFFGTIQSQNNKIDSLKNALELHTLDDTTKVDLLYNLARSNYRIDKEKSIEYLQVAEALSDSLNYEKGKANNLYFRGVTLMYQGDYDLATTHFQKSIALNEQLGLKGKIADNYNALGSIYSNLSEFDKAIEYYNKALAIDKELGKEKNIPNYITNIGIIYYETGEFDKALANIEESLTLYTKHDNFIGITNNLNVIAIIHENKGNYPLAIESHKKALDLAKKLSDSISISTSLSNLSMVYKKLGNYERALNYLNQSLYIQENRNNKQEIAGVKSNIASIYIHQKKFDEAVVLLKESLATARAFQNKKRIAECLNNLGYVYVSLKKYDEAIECYKESKEITQTANFQETLCFVNLGLADAYLEQQLYNTALPFALESLEISTKLQLKNLQKETYKLLSEIYNYKGDFKKALYNHKQYKILNDSLFNKENIEKIVQIENEFKYKQALDSANIRELELTKTVLSTSQHLEKSRRNLLLGIIAFLITSLFLGSIVFRQKLKNEKAKTENILVEQKLMRSQMTPHFIFNSLSVLQGMILNKEDQKSVSYLSKFSKLLRTVLENSRDKTVVLEQELDAINNYLALQNLENSNYSYNVVVDKNIDTTAFKIPPMLIQPFVENAIEHAFTNEIQERNIQLNLSFKNQQLVCKIIVNGIGVDTLKIKANNKKSLSTLITSERFSLLSKYFKMKGSIAVEDRSKFNEQGTIVTLIIPYHKN